MLVDLARTRLSHPGIDLDTYIQDVVDVLEFEDLGAPTATPRDLAALLLELA